MKSARRWGAGTVAGVCLLAVQPLSAEQLTVVKVNDMVKQPTYQVVDANELRALKKEIDDETALFPKALAAVKKEWTADETNKGVPFPESRLSPRRLSTVGTFTDREQAQKRVETCESADLKDVGDAATKRRKMSDKEKERIAKEEEKAALAGRVAELVAAKIEELRKAGPGGAGAEAPKADKPAAPKPGEKEPAGGL